MHAVALAIILATVPFHCNAKATNPDYDLSKLDPAQRQALDAKEIQSQFGEVDVQYYIQQCIQGTIISGTMGST